MSWKVTVFAPRDVVQAALIAHEDAWDWDHDIVIAGSEIAEDRPEDWQLEAWLDRKPTKADQNAIADLFEGTPPKLNIEKLPETDWVTLSQQGVEPIREGVFHVHTPEYAPLDERGVRDFVIPASQAFGTGQHATTAGCLAMLSHMKRQGVTVRNLAISAQAPGCSALPGCICGQGRAPSPATSMRSAGRWWRRTRPTTGFRSAMAPGAWQWSLPPAWIIRCWKRLALTTC